MASPEVFFVDCEEGVRVLCARHHEDLCPASGAVAVTDLEQKQSILFFDASIQCEVCTGLVLGR
jgi:hypothetical protein